MRRKNRLSRKLRSGLKGFFLIFFYGYGPCEFVESVAIKPIQNHVYPKSTGDNCNICVLFVYYSIFTVTLACSRECVFVYLYLNTGLTTSPNQTWTTSTSLVGRGKVKYSGGRAVELHPGQWLSCGCCLSHWLPSAVPPICWSGRFVQRLLRGQRFSPSGAFPLTRTHPPVTATTQLHGAPTCDDLYIPRRSSLIT